MASKTGEPEYTPQTADANAAAEARAHLEKQEASKQAEATLAVEPAAKKDETVPEPEKKEVASSDVEEKKTKEPVTETALSATAAIASAPIPAATGPTAVPATSSSELAWPETPADHPLTQFFDSVTTITTEADYSEIYGITLSTDKPFQTKLILQKFLRANANDLPKAKTQLLDTLKWRKEFNPSAAVEETFGKEFEGLGWMLELTDVPGSTNEKDIATFNVYGAVKDNKKTFGDVENFLRWRVALMERSVQKLNLSSAKTPIPDFGAGPDPYQGIQVHDYLNISFLRMDPDIKAASKKTIEVLGRHYPETLSRKFFVNVPVVMGWLFAARKLIVAPETARKFHMLSYGNTLVNEIGPGIPKVYGGTKGDLAEIGEGMKIAE